MTKIINLLLVLSIIAVGAGCKADNNQVIEEDEIVVDDEIVTEPDEIVGETYYTNTSADEIVVDSPLSGAEISSPVTITGQARGSWFFEATAPVSVVNWDGLIIGEGYIQAIGEWMTEDFVEFEGEITFTDPTYKNNGVVILQNSNPSDLSENDKAVEIPIYFAEMSK